MIEQMIQRQRAEAALRLAAEHDRPVTLPLELNAFRSRDRTADEPADPDALIATT